VTTVQMTKQLTGVQPLTITTNIYRNECQM